MGKRQGEVSQCSGLAGAARAWALHIPKVVPTPPSSPTGPGQTVVHAELGPCFPSHHCLQFPFLTLPGACLLSFCVLENSPEERNPSTIIFLNTKLSKKMLFCQWFKNPYDRLDGQDCTAGQGGTYSIGYLSPSSLYPGCQDFSLSARIWLCPLPTPHCCISTGSYTHTLPFLASSSSRTSRKWEQQKLELSRVGNAWDMGVLVGSVHPEIKVAVAIFWLSMDTAVPGDS